MKNLLKQVVATVAPTLGTALGGPFGGVALKFLADKFVGGDTGKVEDFLFSASSNPETLLELKKAELEFVKFIQEAGIKKHELEVKDRESARELAKDRGLIVQALLSAVFIGGYFVFMALFFVGNEMEVADKMLQPFLILVGVLTAAVPQILSFWFGSSRGSKEKDEAVAGLIQGMK